MQSELWLWVLLVSSSRFCMQFSSLVVWLGAFYLYYVTTFKDSSMVLIHACRRLSRDYLFAINSQRRCAVLDTTVRDLISHLRLHRRRCRSEPSDTHTVVYIYSLRNTRKKVRKHYFVVSFVEWSHKSWKGGQCLQKCFRWCTVRDVCSSRHGC